MRFVPNPGSRRKRSLSRGPLHSWAFLFLKNTHFSPSPEHATFLMDQNPPHKKKAPYLHPSAIKMLMPESQFKTFISLLKGNTNTDLCQVSANKHGTEFLMKASSRQKNNLIHYCECHLFQCLSFSPILSHVSGTTRSLALICASLTFEVTLALAILHVCICLYTH